MSEGEAPRVVVVEDDQVNRDAVVRALTRMGYHVTAFALAEPALDHLRSDPDVSLVITDLVLPGMDGFGVLAAAREIVPEVGVLMITGHASVESAVDAMKRGADDYLTKPVELFELRKRASAIVEKRLLSRRVVELESRLGEKFGELIGGSRSMQALFRQMELVAPTRSNVLIVGESGTGKELVANALHEHSPRRAARFLPINCAAIPAEILESELFGHEKGAFTGATARKIGKFELADKGTLFLDEIGELPLEMQVKLLRVLEQRELMRVGGSDTIRIDIRLVAATNADLEGAVERGRFRSDLYYRLKVVTLRIPPLRERRDDIPRLANHFLAQFTRENQRERMRLTAEAMRALVDARWEGNVRELRNLIESLVVLTPHDDIAVEDLPEEYRNAAAAPAAAPPPARPLSGGRPAPEGRTMEEIERQAILRTLERTGGNRTQAAEQLGIGLRTLQRKLKEYVSRGLLPEEGAEP
ncbi:MAG TPA: sigma-54 dependent transcriptional regulator [Candidatus Polarisedimenticolaceae bacterium]|nr:sigma-54 dependent transcriptional regulator [Candidatus Polarisedimenticolaceae bacterium]